VVHVSWRTALPVRFFCIRQLLISGFNNVDVGQIGAGDAPCREICTAKKQGSPVV
jgi:hypothetical protein